MNHLVKKAASFSNIKKQVTFVHYNGLRFKPAFTKINLRVI